MLNGELGDIVVSEHNVMLEEIVNEKLTSTFHANGRDYWVLFHRWNNNEFVSYLVTEFGVSPVPITSGIGSVHFSTSDLHGQMKLSMQGNKLAAVFPEQKRVESFDFDRCLGSLSDGVLLNKFGDLSTLYGIEFSPNENYVYTTSSVGGGYEFDLAVPGSNNIIELSDFATYPHSWSMQLAPDGKIYLAQFEQLGDATRYLGVIENPNEFGTGSNYVANGLDLSDGTWRSLLNLPNFPTAILDTLRIEFEGECFGDSTRFKVHSPVAVDSMLWVFGDSIAGVPCTSKELSPVHYYPAQGCYYGSVYYWFSGVEHTRKMPVCIGTPPSPLNLILPEDTAICFKDTLHLSAPLIPSHYYLWSDSSRFPQAHIRDSSEWVWLEVYNQCGSIRDSLHVTQIMEPVINLGNDTTICLSDALLLNATFPFATSYQWNTGSTSPSISVDMLTNASVGDKIEVQVSTICGTTTDFIDVSFYPFTNFSLGADQDLCFSETTTLQGPVYNTSGSSYLWSSGNTNSSQTVSYSGGTFILTVTNVCGVFTDAVNINYETPLSINLGSDTTLCPSDTLLLNAFHPQALSYLWQDGKTIPQYEVTNSGIFQVSLSTALCEYLFSREVSYLPIFNLPGDTTLCMEEVLLLDASYNNASYLWQDGSTSNTFSVVEQGIYYVKIESQCPAQSDTISVSYEDCSIYIPNVFTPNGDGWNESFFIRNVQRSTWSLHIYNRWGILLYKSDRYANDWNGYSFSGQPVPDGVYYYLLSNANETYKGFVQVMR